MTLKEFFPQKNKKTFTVGYLKIENYQQCRLALVDACEKKPDIFIVLQKAAKGTLEKPEGGKKFYVSLTGHLRDDVETSVRCDDATKIEMHWRYDATRRTGRSHPQDALEAACQGLEDWLQRRKPRKSEREQPNVTDDPRAYRRQRSEDLKRDKNLIYDETLHLPLEERGRWQWSSPERDETPPEAPSADREASHEAGVRIDIRKPQNQLEKDIWRDNDRFERLRSEKTRETRSGSKPDASKGISR